MLILINENVDADDSLGLNYADSTKSLTDLWQRAERAISYVFENFREALMVVLGLRCYVLQTIQQEITGWDIPKEGREKVEVYLERLDSMQ